MATLRLSPHLGHHELKEHMVYSVTPGESGESVFGTGGGAQVRDFAGLYVKEADKHICKAVKDMGRMVNNAVMVHTYPFCWRSDTPLIYRAVPSWFVKVEQIRDELCANNEKTYWVPSMVKEKRFRNWLANAHDWAVSPTERPSRTPRT